MREFECGAGSRVGFVRCKKEMLKMSVSHKSESWVDRWFPLLVIAFGLLFLALLVGFKPMG